jgi:hypothetical protein
MGAYLPVPACMCTTDDKGYSDCQCWCRHQIPPCIYKCGPCGIVLCFILGVVALSFAFYTEANGIDFDNGFIKSRATNTFSVIPEDTPPVFQIKNTLCLPANASLDLVACDMIRANLSLYRTVQYKKCLHKRILPDNTTTNMTCPYRVVGVVNIFKNYGFNYQEGNVTKFYRVYTYPYSLGKCFELDIDCIGQRKDTWIYNGPPTTSYWYYRENNPSEYYNDPHPTRLSILLGVLCAVLLGFFVGSICCVCCSHGCRCSGL